MNNRILACAITIIAFFAFCNYSDAFVVDPPHNQSNNISCSSCHTYSLWWHYSPVTDQSETPDHTDIPTSICLTCHGSGGSAPFVQGHNSKNLLSTYHSGNWSLSCINCHDPHFQEQLDWVTDTTYPNGLYLATGTIDSSSTELNGSFIKYDAASDTTSFVYRIDPTHDEVGTNWRVPATWLSKNKSARAALLVDRIYSCSNLWTLQDVTIDSGTDDGNGGIDTLTPKTATGIITVRGKFTPDSLQNGISDIYTFGIVYGQLIKKNVTDLNGVSHSVKFFDPNGGFVSPDAHGICQVCHTETTRYTNDGAMPAAGDTHEFRNNTVCVNCHKHNEGFKGSGHNSTNLDFGWENISYTKRDGSVVSIDCSTCHSDNGKGVVAGIHGDKCVLCHINPKGGGALRIAGNNSLTDGVDSSNGIDGDPNGEYGRNYSSTCADCHDKSRKNNIENTLPDIHHLSSPNNYAANGNCTACHRDAAGNGLADADHSTAIQLTYNSGTYPNIVNGCEPCHKIDTSTTPPTDYRTNGTTTGARINSANPRVHDSCTACHNVDSSLKNAAEVQNPDRLVPGYAPVYGAANTCFTCHGNSPGIVHLGVSHLDKVGNTEQCNWCHYKQVGQLDGATVDPNDNMVHDGCTTCHTISKGVAGDFMIGLVNPANLTRGLVGNIVTPASKGSAVNCTDCHTTHLFSDHKHPDHTAIVRVSSEGCTDSCHAGTYAFPGPDFGMPVDPANNKVHDACTSCHNTTTGQLRTVTEVNLPYVIAMPNGLADASGNNIPNNGGGECSACHGSSYFNKHGYGANHLRVSMRNGIDQSVGVACANCHGQNTDQQGSILDSWTDIKALHDVITNGSGPCATCHKSNRTDVIATIRSGQSGNNVGCIDCHADRVQFHADHIVMGVITGTAFCTGCHDKNDVNTSAYFINTIHKGNCGNCHLDPTNGDYSMTGSALGHSRDDIGFGNPNNCETCHTNIAASWYNHDIDHLATNRVNVAVECANCHNLTPFTDSNDPKKHDSCATCHNSDGSMKGIAQNGIGGGAVCTTCHGNYFPNHQSIDHTNFVSLSPKCAGCHEGTEGTISGMPVSSSDNKKHDSCSTCHNSDGSLRSLATGNGNGAQCTDCHGTSVGAIHHASFPAKNGECVTCHKANVGQPGTSRANGNLDMPANLACNWCHLYFPNKAYSTDSNGKVKIFSFTFNPNQNPGQGLTNINVLTTHTISTNTSKPISDYSACFACHGAVRFTGTQGISPKVVPFHGFGTPYTGDTPYGGCTSNQDVLYQYAVENGQCGSGADPQTEARHPGFGFIYGLSDYVRMATGPFGYYGGRIGHRNLFLHDGDANIHNLLTGSALSGTFEAPWDDFNSNTTSAPVNIQLDTGENGLKSVRVKLPLVNLSLP